MQSNYHFHGRGGPITDPRPHHHSSCSDIAFAGHSPHFISARDQENPMMTEKKMNDAADLEPLLTPHEVKQIFRIDISTLTRLCKRGALPKPLKIGCVNRWRVSDIRAV